MSEKLKLITDLSLTKGKEVAKMWYIRHSSVAYILFTDNTAVAFMSDYDFILNAVDELSGSEYDDIIEKEDD